MMTQLDAVNVMLAGIGEAPVTTLVTPNADVASAVSILERVTREVLTTGWGSNTDDNVELVPTAGGQIIVPADALSVDTIGRSASVDVVVRVDPTDSVRKLWNRKTNSFTFADKVIVRIIRELPFESLSPTLARYVAATAACRFQSDNLGANSLDARLKEERLEAMIALQDAEAEQDDTNVLTSSPHCAWITARYNPLFGR